MPLVKIEKQKFPMRCFMRKMTPHFMLSFRNLWWSEFRRLMDASYLAAARKLTEV